MTRVHRALGSSSLVLFLFAFLIPTGNPATVAAALGTKQVPGDWCHPIAARTASPVGTGACSGVRPGAFFSSPIGGCSFNFLFKGADGQRYMGTAGHCLVGEGKERSWAPGKGPVINAGGRVVGHAAYGILNEVRDFGLIRLDAGVKASPSMCHFGGPTGTYTERSSGPVFVEHYGNGLAISSVLPARTSVAMNTSDPDYVTATGLAAFGDSGSGATVGGKALGVLVSIGISSASIGNVFITRLPPQVARAERMLGTQLTLQTAPRR
ncbi:MAG TPA: hypothetical protein VFA34_01115 [Actinomycetota bacterium]|jgi:hypothetical protein|nr:hypothetical protein [Actinomycetota bacterium]